MQTKIVLAIVAVALVAAALVGVTAAQLVNTQTPIITVGPNGQVLPPCVTANNGVVPPYCINGTTGQPYCYANSTGVYCNNGIGAGICQNGGCYGYAAQNQNSPIWRWHDGQAVTVMVWGAADKRHKVLFFFY